MADNPSRIVIMGAAGRDFHNFNMLYRDDPGSRVVAFTAAQIPDIAGRQYPPSLAGPLYPRGVPIVSEDRLADLVRDEAVDRVMFAYSDVTHEHVMHRASMAIAAGADFILAGPGRTMIRAQRPVIAVSAVRTGCGKSQTARWISRRLHEHGVRAAVLRHPMPYGDLERQAVQRFAAPADLTAAACTVEEREEYEPHLAVGNVVYAGVDYQAIVARAEEEAQVLLWDGGNNDFPFLSPDLHIVLADALRPGHETHYHPGEAVLRMAHVVVISKANAASEAVVRGMMDAAHGLAPGAAVLRGASRVRLADETLVRGRRVLVIEDGPTLTHIGPVLPALGYGPAQLRALAETIARVHADVVISATPCDLASLITIPLPIVRAFYDFAEMDDPGLGAHIDAFLAS